LPPIEEVALTTNGILFREKAEELKEAGLNRVNISLDTLRPDRYVAITGEDAFDSVWRSVLTALELNFSPVKINVVLFEGLNDDEILDFAELTRKYPLSVRFIEYMETAGERDGYKYVSNEVVFERLKSRYEMVEGQQNPRGNGPAKYISIRGAEGRIGFISPKTDCFCDSCNRLRLSCDGKLYPCLFSSHCLDVRVLIRGGKGDKEIADEISKLMEDKHRFTRRRDAGGEIKDVDKPRGANIDMCYIGG
jgi:cyclic pyranopterin phosphate synthase